MAVRLSRAAWNNVIIFSVMGFILLINMTQNSFDDSGDSLPTEQSIIGEGKVILTMTIDQQVTIERVGQSWQMRPARIAPQLIEQMMRSWHQATGRAVDMTVDRQSNEGLIISTVVAGQQNILMFTLYLIDQQLIVFNHQTGRYLALPEVMFNQLIPTGLIE